MSSDPTPEGDVAGIRLVIVIFASSNSSNPSHYNREEHSGRGEHSGRR